jgi:hypothetical protein
MKLPNTGLSGLNPEVPPVLAATGSNDDPPIFRLIVKMWHFNTSTKYYSDYLYDFI